MVNDTRGKLFIVISLFLIAISCAIFPFQFLHSNERSDNPQNCPYYITLQSVLANYPLLSYDKANVKFIKNRLLKFEKDAAMSSKPALSAYYQKTYLQTLQNAGFASIRYVQHPEQIITLASPLMQLMTFIFDLPSVSYEGFHAVYAAVYFILAIVGSFGFYLFLKYAAKIHFLFALFGGFLFFFSGGPVLNQMFNADGGILLAPYAMFPYALLFISLAFEKNSFRFAIVAGTTLAAQFFFLAPHPEGVIYSIMFYAIYSYYLMRHTISLEKYRKYILVGTSLTVFLILSAYTLVPIMYDKFTGNMFVFAHTGDIKHGRLEQLQLYAIVLGVLILLRRLLQHRINFSPVFLSSLNLSIAIIIFMGLTWVTTIARMLSSVLHIGIHFWYIFRPGMYLTLSIFIVFLMMLDEIAKLAARAWARKTVLQVETQE